MTGAQLAELIERPPTTPGGGADDELGAPVSATGFTLELVEGVEEHRDELDGLIEEHAIDWHVERIAPLERAILRVALLEIIHRADVPDEVAIDEAVETAKLYCGAQAPAFVNGVLGGVVRKVKHV